MAALFRSPLAWQLGAVLVATAAVALTPPARGAMLLVALDGDEGAAARTAVAAGAALVRVGPLPGSVVVVGDRARLAGRLLAAHVLPVAAPPGGCGAGAGAPGAA